MNAMTNHALGIYHSLQLAQVIDNADPDGRGRVQIQLASASVQMWAGTVVASGGDNYGTVFIPKVGEIVVVAFVSPELPLVLGSIWSGSGSAPADAEAVEDHYVIRTPSGLVIEMDDAEGPKVDIRTDSGHHIQITDEGGGEIVIDRGGDSVVLDSEGISITAASKVKIEAGQVEVSAGMVKVDAGMSKFSGVIQADTVITNSVVSSSYTPGAGNIW